MKRIIIAVIILSVLTSCSRMCTTFNRDLQVGDRYYIIEMYSGGKVVYRDDVRTMINNSENSDGIFYYKGDTLIEISGDYVLKSVN